MNFENYTNCIHKVHCIHKENAEGLIDSALNGVRNVFSKKKLYALFKKRL